MCCYLGFNEWLLVLLLPCNQLEVRQFSPLTSGIKGLLPKELPLTRYFLFSGPFFVGPGGRQFLKHQQAGANTHALFKVT